MTLATIQRLSRYLGWLAVAAIFLLSLVPGHARPQTGLPGILEHFGAYLAVSLLLSVGHFRRASPFVIAVLLGIVAINLELLQLLIPHRHGHPFDAAAGAAGALAGALLATGFLRWWPRFFD